MSQKNAINEHLIPKMQKNAKNAEKFNKMQKIQKYSNLPASKFRYVIPRSVSIFAEK
jgi:hypothetical protein